MKIINRKQFLALPKDTLFSKFQPNVFGVLSIKGDTLYNGDNELFAIYERQDVVQLINRLHDCTRHYEITDKGIEALCKPDPMGLIEIEAS